ncbi:MAG: alanine racemase [Acidobacteriota bacterium]|nr:alanine racemase [Acidobacteriota bacterium]MDH3524969.1 alanine racemase [Acidobacteriota bacterium]
MTRELAALPTPALVLDLDKLEANVERMAAKADALGVRLRPHLKTHKCERVARLQLDRSRAGATVATLAEARYFAAHGVDDLTWAFPVILSRLEEAAELARRCTLRLVVDSPEAVAALEDLGRPLHVWLKVDCGYHRAGVDPEGDALVALGRRLAGSRRLVFDGLLSHSGHAYRAASPEIARRVADEERDLMVRAKERLARLGVEVPALSIGSTPAMAAVRSLAGIDEVRPGNYAFFDYTQVRLGACRVADCAVTVLASVVSRGRAHSVVDAGALALSKDAGPAGGTATMGEIFADYAAAALSEDLRVVSLSQEHGILSRPQPVGRRLRILPNHSCLTVAHFDEYAVVRGEEVVDRWPIHRAR